MTTPKIAVFCIDCHFYISDLKQHPDQCNHPSNLKDTYDRPKSVHIKRPGELNKINKCKNFKPIEKSKESIFVFDCFRGITSAIIRARIYINKWWANVAFKKRQS